MIAVKGEWAPLTVQIILRSKRRRNAKLATTGSGRQGVGPQPSRPMEGKGMLSWFTLRATLLACFAGAGCTTSPASNGPERIENDEYRFAASLPVGAVPCASMSGTHPHGYLFTVHPIGESCETLGVQSGEASVISIWADYNAWFATDIDQISQADCAHLTQGEPPVPLDDLRVNYLVSRVCTGPRSDGRLAVIVSAAGGDPNGESPYSLIYTLSLSTTQDRFAADLATFRAVVDSFALLEPDGHR